MSQYSIPSVVEKTIRGERAVDIYSRLLTDRIVYIGTEIDDGVANVVIAQLLHLESERPESDINLYLNSPGGSVTATLAIYDTMQFIGSPVTTTCVGQAASTAALLLAGLYLICEYYKVPFKLTVIFEVTSRSRILRPRSSRRRPSRMSATVRLRRVSSC